MQCSVICKDQQPDLSVFSRSVSCSGAQFYYKNIVIPHKCFAPKLCSITIFNLINTYFV